MDRASYSIVALEKKYDRFIGPSIEIKLGGRKLDTTKIPVNELEVELSAEGAAGGCTFTVDGLFDHEKSQWKSDLAASLQVGAKLEITGGYTKRHPLFYGYVDEYTMEHSSDAAPRLVISGLDGLGYLMNCKEPYYGGKKKHKEVITELLKKSVSAGFAKKVDVDSAYAMQTFISPIIKEQVDDFAFLRILAARYGMVLMGVNGELVFDALWKKSAAIIELSVGKGLLSFTKRVSLKGQVGYVVIWGRDVNQKFIQGRATTVKVGGTGKTAAQLASGIKKAGLREYSEYARTKEECNHLAQAKLDAIAMDLVSGEGTCIGIPELIPGRYIKISNMGDELEGVYFLSKVTHSFTSEGYYTKFEVKGARVL